jgi:hypothetical protein
MVAESFMFGNTAVVVVVFAIALLVLLMGTVRVMKTTGCIAQSACPSFLGLAAAGVLLVLIRLFV